MPIYVLTHCQKNQKFGREYESKEEDNGLRVRALLNRGSLVTLLNSNIKSEILNKGSYNALTPAIKLCGADGWELSNQECFSVHCKIGPKTLWHSVMFIDNLQV